MYSERIFSRRNAPDTDDRNAAGSCHLIDGSRFSGLIAGPDSRPSRRQNGSTAPQIDRHADVGVGDRERVGPLGFRHAGELG